MPLGITILVADCRKYVGAAVTLLPPTSQTTNLLGSTPIGLLARLLLLHTDVGSHPAADDS